MTTLTATFDGLVFKPDARPDLRPNTRVRIIVEAEEERSPRGLLQFAGTIDAQSAREMREAIEEGCEST